MKHIKLFEKYNTDDVYNTVKGNIYVKRKKDGLIGQIESTISSTIFFKHKIKYEVNFNDKIEEYDINELEKPTLDEIELFLNLKKYNL